LKTEDRTYVVSLAQLHYVSATDGIRTHARINQRRNLDPRQSLNEGSLKVIQHRSSVLIQAC